MFTLFLKLCIVVIYLSFDMLIFMKIIVKECSWLNWPIRNCYQIRAFYHLYIFFTYYSLMMQIQHGISSLCLLYLNSWCNFWILSLWFVFFFVSPLFCIHNPNQPLEHLHILLQKSCLRKNMMARYLISLFT